MSRSSFELSGTSRNFPDLWQPARLVVLALLLGVAVAQLPLVTAAGLILGSGILLLALVQPLVGLFLAVLVGPFGALENLALDPSFPESGQLMFWMAVAAWLGHGVLRRRIVLPRTELNRPLALFVAIVAISLLGARSLELGIKELVKWLELGLAMWIVVSLVEEARGLPAAENSGPPRLVRSIPLRWLLLMLLSAGLLQALIGVWQFGLRGDGPDHFMILDRFYRASGTFFQPNPFGGFMALSASLAIGSFIGLAVFWIQAGKSRRTLSRRNWLWIAFMGSSAAITSLALLMSWSRGAWLGFAAAMAMLLLFLPRRRLLGALLLVMALAIFLVGIELHLIPASITGRLGDFGEDLRIGDVRGVDLDEADYAVTERLAHWQAGVEMARDNLLFGVGFGNYEAAYHDYALINWPHPLGHAHNYYLNAVAEIGVVGLIAYLFVWVVIFRQLLRLLRRLAWPHRGVALGLLAAWSALAVHHVVDKMYVNNVYIYLGVMLGIQQVLARYDE